MRFDDIDIETLRRGRGMKWNTYGPDVLPAWVADMDFPVAPPIRRRLQELLDASDFGYPQKTQEPRLADLLVQRCEKRFAWHVDRDRVEVIVDVVQGLQMCLQMFTRAGQGAAMLTPVYPPFLSTTRAMGRRIDHHTLSPGNDGFEIDWERMESSIKADTRVLLLCNPHNPTGRVLTRAELMGLAELSLKHDLIVVSDEIHGDLVLEGREHIPFASLGPEVEARTVTLMSASKAFNIAGLRCAMMVFGSRELHELYRDGPRFLRGGASSLGMHAAEVAWTECDQWLSELLRYLEANRDLIGQFLAEHLPQIHFRPPQATYLAWLDCSGLGLGGELWRTILDRGRLALSNGVDFGPGGENHLRLNFATSRDLLHEALLRLERGVAS